MKKTFFTLIICIIFSTPAFAKKEIDCKAAISEHTEWVANDESISTNATVAGTPAGFGSLMNWYSSEMSGTYDIKKLDYDLEKWTIFGMALYGKDGEFLNAFIFSAPKSGYSDCGFNATTVFSVKKKN